MRSLLRPLALVALAPALFAQDASNRIPADLAALIPSDASSLIYLAPIDEIEESIQEMLAIVAPDMEMMADADMLLSELSPPGFNIDLIDRSRPIAVAIGAITVETQQSGPRFFVLIPTTDAAGLLAALPTGEPFSSRITGGYLGLSNADRYPVGGKASALPGVLPAGMLAMTLDAEPILDAFAPIAEFMMGMGKNGLLQEMRSDSEVPPALLALAEGALDGSLSFVTDALDSISSFDLGFGIQGAEVDLGYGLNFREGSPLTKLTNTAGPRFRDMLKLVDTNAAGSSVVGFDLGSLARWARPYVDQILDSIPVPDEMEPGESLGPFQSPRHAFEAVRGAINASIDTLAWFGDGVATSAYFSGNEMRTASWMHGVQADQLADSLEALFQVELASLVGLNIERSRIGDSVINLSMTFDLDTLGRNFQLGEEELSEMRRELKGVVDMEVNLSLTTVGAQTLMLYNGGRNDIALALKSVKANPGLASSELRLLADKVGDAYPFAVYRFNLGPFAAGMIRMAEGMGESTGVPAGVPETLDGISIPMSIFEGIDSKRVFQGLHIDLTQASKIVALVMQMQSVEVAPEQPR